MSVLPGKISTRTQGHALIFISFVKFILLNMLFKNLRDRQERKTDTTGDIFVLADNIKYKTLV